MWLKKISMILTWVRGIHVFFFWSWWTCKWNKSFWSHVKIRVETVFVSNLWSRPFLQSQYLNSALLQQYVGIICRLSLLLSYIFYIFTCSISFQRLRPSSSSVLLWTFHIIQTMQTSSQKTKVNTPVCSALWFGSQQLDFLCQILCLSKLVFKCYHTIQDWNWEIQICWSVNFKDCVYGNYLKCISKTWLFKLI